MTDHPLTWEEAVVSLREQPDSSDFVAACFYDDPLLAAAERYWSSTEWRSIRRHLSRTPGRVLEVGAGRGIASYAFARDGWTVTALEPDPSSIVGAGAIRSLAIDSDLTIEVVEEWGENLPFADASFDVVFCRAVLHHAHDLMALVREIGRVLKPGGRFIGAREHVISKPAHLGAFLDSHPLHRMYGGEHAYTLQEYRRAIERGGLNIKRALDSYADDINLYPRSRSEIRRKIADKVKLPFLTDLVPDAVFSYLGNRDHTPGRLYTFIADKPGGE